MFDPFGDYASAGYLRNFAAEKNLELVKAAEHELFRAQLPDAFEFLATCQRITYSDFLKVHEILFGGLYPWAGQDRTQLLPGRAVTKGNVFFAHPQSCRLAVEDGLFQAQERSRMADHPGLVMGLFAYGHPFLDGNGRAMLVVHAELCYRAGISIDWMGTRKDGYLDALTREIESPNDGHLDKYLRPFVRNKIPREAWMKAIGGLQGLDGTTQLANESASYSDPDVMQQYHDFESRRNYKLGKG